MNKHTTISANGNIHELFEAFAAIENHDLKVATIICTICGCVIYKDKVENEVVCDHLKEMFEL